MSDLLRNYLAQGAIVAYRLIKFGTADGTMAQAAGSTDAIVGVADELGTDDTERGDAMRSGPCLVQLGGSVTRGDLLTSDNQGRAVKAVPSGAAQAAITAITKANPGAVTAVAHGFASGDQVLLTGVAGMVEADNKVFTVTVVDADHFTLGADTTGFTTYTGGGTATKLASASAARIRTIGVAEVSGVAYDIVPHIFVPGSIPG